MKIRPNPQKSPYLKREIELILDFYSLKFPPRTLRITVLYLQGEGRYKIVRPGSSLFTLQFLEIV